MKSQVLNIKNLTVVLKPGLDAEKLVEKIDHSIKQFAEDGDYWFKYDIEE